MQSNKIVWGRLIALFMLMCGAALPLWGADAQVTLELTSPKSSYLVDEPLYVVVAVRNTGPTECGILRYLDPASDIVNFEVTAPGEQSHPVKYWVSASYTREGIEKGLVYLAPGEQYSAAVDLTYEMRDGNRLTVLSRPGEYTLRACYSIPADWPAGPITIWSNEIQLMVISPEGVDREAYDMLQAGARTHDRGIWNAAIEQAECYERILQYFPGSTYAIYAAFYLAQAYGFQGEEPLRGTDKARSMITSEAALLSSVAQEAGDTPLGIYAMRLAGASRARLGEVVQAESMLAQSFLSPAATDNDRLEALSWMNHVESGEFERSGGLYPESQGAKLNVPLSAFAKALGFSVGWNAEANTATVTSARVKANLRPGESEISINGVPRTGVRTALKDGRTLVSPSVIATLMAEKYGPGMAHAFPANLIAKAPAETAAPR